MEDVQYVLKINKMLSSRIFCIAEVCYVFLKYLLLVPFFFFFGFPPHPRWQLKGDGRGSLRRKRNRGVRIAKGAPNLRGQGIQKVRP